MIYEKKFVAVQHVLTFLVLVVLIQFLIFINNIKNHKNYSPYINIFHKLKNHSALFVLLADHYNFSKDPTHFQNNLTVLNNDELLLIEDYFYKEPLNNHISNHVHTIMTMILKFFNILKIYSVSISSNDLLIKANHIQILSMLINEFQNKVAYFNKDTRRIL